MGARSESNSRRKLAYRRSPSVKPEQSPENTGGCRCGPPESDAEWCRNNCESPDNQVPLPETLISGETTPGVRRVLRGGADCPGGANCPARNRSCRAPAPLAVFNFNECYATFQQHLHPQETCCSEGCGLDPQRR